MPEKLQENRVAVFGGEGHMGKLTVELFQRLGYETLSIDPRNPESPTATDAIERSRVVFFSVLPIESIEEIINQNQGLLADHLVLDNASIKASFASAYESLDSKGISVCSTHPMCKHDQPLHGQNALILEVGNNAKEARALAESLYQNASMITVPLSFEDHDRTMTVVQLVPHLVMRSIGKVLEQNGIDVQKLREIAPANFQLFNLSMWRTINQDPLLSASIITSLLKQPEGKALAKDITAAIRDITRHKNKDKLKDKFEASYGRNNRDGFGVVMNDVTTTVLERLANLNRLSVHIETTGDQPGLLRALLEPFETEGINLTAIDSHRQKNGVRFDIGLDETGYDPTKLMKIAIRLHSMGYNVIGFD